MVTVVWSHSVCNTTSNNNSPLLSLSLRSFSVCYIITRPS